MHEVRVDREAVATWPYYFSLNRSLLLLLLYSMTMGLLNGCTAGPSVTWTTDTVSPDKHWTAKARSEIVGGMGGQLDQTVVTMQDNRVHNSERDILILSHEYSSINMRIDWLSAQTLMITYRDSGKPGDHIIVNFRAVSYGSVHIITRSDSAE